MKGRHIIFFALMLSLFNRADAQDGLVGYWNFDETVGVSFMDQTANENHGTIAGAERIPGIKGNALSFNGVNDFGLIGNSQHLPPEELKGLGEGSISLWFKVNHIPLDHGIAPIFYYGSEEKCDYFDAANQGLILEVGHSPVHSGSKRLYFTIWKNGCTLPSFCFDSNESIDLGEWYHLVVVVGTNFNTAYLNGKEIINRRYNFGSSANSQFFEDAVKHERLWLGKGHWDRTVQHLDGAIDELRIYDRPLSADEVKILYENVTTAISENRQKKDNNSIIKIYPNPATDLLYFRIEEPIRNPLTLNIIDMQGKLIIDHNVRSSFGTIDIKDLVPGIYTLRLSDENAHKEEKFIIRN
jgi:hypothetical protein